MMILYSRLSESPGGGKVIVLICQRSSEGERKIKANLEPTLEGGWAYLSRKNAELDHHCDDPYVGPI
jgi:hypothetical protein